MFEKRSQNFRFSDQVSALCIDLGENLIFRMVDSKYLREKTLFYQVPALWIDLGENLDDVCCCYPIPPGSSLSIMFENICI